MPNQRIVVVERTPTVEIPFAVPSVTVVETGMTGPAGATGPQGPPGPSPVALTKIAQSALGGQRVVVLLPDGVQCEYADNTDPADMRLSVGITKTSAGTGDIVEIHTFGEWEEVSWSWTPGDILFLGTNGLITTTPPSAPAFMRVIGVAISATKIYFDAEPPVVLA